jgi:hypothetical protein
MESKGRSVLDTPAFAGYDDFLLGPLCSPVIASQRVARMRAR